MDLIKLVRVSTGEGVVCVDEKAGLTQQLPQEDSEYEISKVHAESDPPVCWVRESQKTTSQPRDNRAAGNDSVGGAKEEAGKRNDLFFLCLKCSSWVSPSSSSNTCGSLSQRHSEHLHSQGPCALCTHVQEEEDLCISAKRRNRAIVLNTQPSLLTPGPQPWESLLL